MAEITPFKWLRRYTLAEFQRLFDPAPVPVQHVLYVFLEKDVRGDVYPLAYFNQSLADKAPRRCSEVVRVEVPLLGKTP